MGYQIPGCVTPSVGRTVLLFAGLVLGSGSKLVVFLIVCDEGRLDGTRCSLSANESESQAVDRLGRIQKTELSDSIFGHCRHERVCRI